MYLYFFLYFISIRCFHASSDPSSNLNVTFPCSNLSSKCFTYPSDSSFSLSLSLSRGFVSICMTIFLCLVLLSVSTCTRLLAPVDFTLHQHALTFQVANFYRELKPLFFPFNSIKCPSKTHLSLVALSSLLILACLVKCVTVGHIAYNEAQADSTRLMHGQVEGRETSVLQVAGCRLQVAGSSASAHVAGSLLQCVASPCSLFSQKETSSLPGLRDG